MSAERRAALRRVLTFALLAVGVLLAHRLDIALLRETADDAIVRQSDQPRLQVSFGRSRLAVRAATVSTDHQQALQALLAEQFAGARIETEFRSGLLLPDTWETISARVLNLIAATTSAQAVVDSQGIRIHGITANVDDYRSRLESLRGVAGDSVEIDSAVTAVGPLPRSQALCARNFATIIERAAAAQPIRFRLSGTELSDAALPLFDRLVEFAHDCRDTRIAVVGYTDATGPEDWNQKVSTARAQAVASELVQRGIEPDRLLVEGRGSQSPLADNDTVQGRTRNRRIEFELR